MWPKKAVGWARGGEGERNGDQEKERDEMQVGAQKGHGGKRRSDWAGLALNTRLGWWPLVGDLNSQQVNLLLNRKNTTCETGLRAGWKGACYVHACHVNAQIIPCILC